MISPDNLKTMIQDKVEIQRRLEIDDKVYENLKLRIDKSENNTKIHSLIMDRIIHKNRANYLTIAAATISFVGSILLLTCPPLSCAAFVMLAVSGIFLISKGIYDFRDDRKFKREVESTCSRLY